MTDFGLSDDYVVHDDLDQDVYLYACKHLHKVWTGELNVYINGLLSGLGTRNVACGAAAFFSKIGLGAIALALECIPSSCSIVFYLDSQAALDACVQEMKWIKVKRHSDIVDNNHADALVYATAHSELVLSVGISNSFFMADGLTIFGNVYYFICDIYHAVNWALWKAGPRANVLNKYTASVWHFDSYMLAEFTSKKSAVLRTYLMKAVHRRLPCYPSVLCLMCGNIEFSDHAFTCSTDLVKSLVDNHFSVSSLVLLIFAEALNDSVYTMLCKDFVLVDWIRETVAVFGDRKSAIPIVINFVRPLAKSHHSRMWLLRSKFRVNMEKSSLVCDTGEIFALLHDLSSLLSKCVVHILGIIESFAINFGFRSQYLFFSGLNNSNEVFVSV
ncbi:hypothetical protein G9A89_020587 [Geosiphon pyriformis]|nr:hypothetical protein G9A89_020587 [Geosiphon pyriformis]